MSCSFVRRGVFLLAVVGLAGSLGIRATPQDQVAASPQDAAFQALIQAARAAIGARKLDEAATAFQTLLDRARAAHADVWEGRALLGLGIVDQERARYAPAESLLTSALAIFARLDDTRDLAYVEAVLGDIAVETNRRDQATAYYGQSADAYATLGDRVGAVRLSVAFLRVAPPDIDTFDRECARLQQEAHALGSVSLEGGILHLWSDVLYARGQYETALEKLQEAASVLEHADDQDELGTVYNSLGRLFRLHGQVRAALDCQLKALAIHEKTGGARSLIQSLNAVAVTYESLGDAVNTRRYFDRALTLATTSGDPTILGFLRANYADFLAHHGDPAAARPMMAQAIEHADPAYLSLRYTQLAEIDLGLRRMDDAQTEANLAVRSCVKPDDPVCIDSHIERALVRAAAGDDTGALDDEQTVLQSIESLHAHLAVSDFLKQGFADRWEPAYSVAIARQVAHGKIREALETAELARSRALLDLLASRGLQTAPTPPLPIAVRGSAPVSLTSSTTASSATTTDLAATASRLHSTLLLYWVTTDHVVIWVLGPDGALHCASVPVDRETLDSWIRATSGFLRTDASHPSTATRGGGQIPLVLQPEPAWSRLYDLLIEPVAAYLPSTNGARLTIVPHGPLLNVPFAALRDPHGRYLIEHYALHSVPAGALLAYTAATRHADARSGSLLLVADPAHPPAIPGEPPLPRLPGADAEVRAIAALVPASRVTLLSHDNATDARVLGAVGHQAVIHFATHAIVRDADPLSSFLALDHPAGATGDGRLSAESIYKLRLDADLVVLSACRSGGAITSGDGVAALARAFFYAGTPSLVVSLWDVADQPTNRLLPAFYRAWLRGAAKDAALRTAQLQLLADLRAGRVTVPTTAGEIVLPEDPAFWAGFVLLGEPD